MFSPSRISLHFVKRMRNGQNVRRLARCQRCQFSRQQKLKSKLAFLLSGFSAVDSTTVIIYFNTLETANTQFSVLIFKTCVSSCANVSLCLGSHKNPTIILNIHEPRWLRYLTALFGGHTWIISRDVKYAVYANNYSCFLHDPWQPCLVC